MNADFNPAALAKLIAREVAAELADGYATGRFAPPTEYLTTVQAASFLGLMPGGMETMRKEGRGPAYGGSGASDERPCRAGAEAGRLGGGYG